MIVRNVYCFFILIIIYLFVGCHSSESKKIHKIILSPSLDSIINHPNSINPVTDSLLLLVKASKDDTSTIDALNKLPEHFFSINTDKAKLFATEALRWADSLHYKKGKSTAIAKISLFYGVMGQTDTAIYLLRKSLIVGKEDLKVQTYCYSVMGNMYLTIGQFDSSTFYSNKAIVLAKHTHDDKLLEYNYGIQAQYFLYAGKPDSSIFYIKKNIQSLEKSNNVSQLAFYHRFLGDIYRNIDNYPKAIDHLKQALFYAKKNNDNRIIAACFITLAVVYESFEENNTAISYYKEGLLYASKTNDLQVETVGFLGLASLYHKEKTDQLAKYYLFKALPFAKSVRNYQYLSSLYLLLTSIANDNNNLEMARHYLDSSLVYVNQKGATDFKPEYYKLQGYILLKQGYLNQAEDSLLKGLNYALTSSNLRQKKAIAKLLSEIHNSEGNYKQAMHYYTLSKNAEDSLMNEVNIKKFAAAEYSLKEQELKLSQEKRENELAIITQKNIQRKNYFLYGSIGMAILLIILLAALYFYFKQEQLKTQQLKLIDEQKRLLLEQKVLRSQMNPHFIYNSLDSIHAFVLDNQAQLASDYLSRFASLMRMVLEQSREEYISIEDEIKSLELYLSLQQLVFENKFTYTISVDEKIDVENIAIPPMLTQPFIENAIKHGIKLSERKGEILIDFKLSNNLLCIEIKDNGVGVTKSKAQHENEQNTHQSLSTKITKERLDLLNKNNKQDISIHIYDTLDINQCIIGTTVHFEIPFKNLY